MRGRTRLATGDLCDVPTHHMRGALSRGLKVFQRFAVLVLPRCQTIGSAAMDYCRSGTWAWKFCVLREHESAVFGDQSTFFNQSLA